jgi:hypothetical protein
MSSPEARYCGLAGAFCKSRRLSNFIVCFPQLGVGQFASTSALVHFQALDAFLEAFLPPPREGSPRWRGQTLIHVKDSGNHSLIVGALSTEGGKDEHRATCDE